MIQSGLSAQMGELFMAWFNGWGVYGALIATYLLTLILTELVTNNAAAALAFPFGYSLALSYGVRSYALYYGSLVRCQRELYFALRLPDQSFGLQCG